MKLNAATRIKAYNTEVERAQIRKEIADMQLKIAKAKDAGQNVESMKKQLEMLKQKLAYANRR